MFVCSFSFPRLSHLGTGNITLSYFFSASIEQPIVAMSLYIFLSINFYSLRKFCIFIFFMFFTHSIFSLNLKHKRVYPTSWIKTLFFYFGKEDVCVKKLSACLNNKINLQEHMKEYRGKAFGTMAPHVFALAESAYSSLQVRMDLILHHMLIVLLI